ncbi:MAG: OmpA family protein [Acidimicrobiia bacterium]|nr:OmpA family protein [Acidimicrobiia bacterium]
MERAVAVLVGGVGIVLLTLAAVAWSGPESGRGGGIEVLALRPGASGGAVAPGGEPGEAAGARGLTGPSGGTTSTALGSPGPGSSTAELAHPSGARPSAAATTSPPESPPLPPTLEGLLSQIASGAIRFEVARSDIDGPGRDLLGRLAAELVAHPDVVVMVRGHTDSTGTVEFNRELSARRAAVVVELLVSLGVPPAQLVAVGVGPTEPVADNATVDGRKANRRSEVLVDGRAP